MLIAATQKVPRAMNFPMLSIIHSQVGTDNGYAANGTKITGSEYNCVCQIANDGRFEKRSRHGESGIGSSTRQ